MDTKSSLQEGIARMDTESSLRGKTVSFDEAIQLKNANL
ncbi:MAG: hypothetical protein IRF12RH_02050 [Rickettsia helvetica]|uniref:Uncharacterized protein n=1 Tax=Rickettsia helvetica TaxID=35789 RepID=A0ABM9NAJ6_RICHE